MQATLAGMDQAVNEISEPIRHDIFENGRIQIPRDCGPDGPRRGTNLKPVIPSIRAGGSRHGVTLPHRLGEGFGSGVALLGHRQGHLRPRFFALPPSFISKG